MDSHADQGQLPLSPKDTRDLPRSPTEFVDGVPSGANLSSADRRYLLALARRMLYLVAADPFAPDPTLAGAELSPALKEKRGCFVTLMKAGSLRGCVGQLRPRVPLYQAVIEHARGAATSDPRFSPVQAAEISDLKIEISVLTESQQLKSESPENLLSKLRPHQDGVTLQLGGRISTFLPQVWEHLPDPVSFMDHLAEKAGCGRSAWRSKDAIVSVYQAECFEEP